MKRIISLLFCMLFIFSACSGKTENKTEINEDNYASYVGAGEMTLINILVKSNAKFVNDVFVAGHLPVDETQTVKNSNGTFALVISEEYKSLNDLKEKLSSIYTENAVDEIIKNNTRYVEIDGKLYLNMDNAKSDYALDWSEPEISAMIDSDGKYIAEITVKNEKGKDVVINASVVSENGNLKLENLYS